MSHPNPYLVDEERRLAHRGELKRELAKIAVTKLRCKELSNIVEKLKADSEAAADEHQAAASVLQAELDGLDAEHVDAILAGAKTGPKSTKRRGEILAELGELNKALELRCEANRRSVRPIEKQIRDLQSTTFEEGVLRNRLASLASPEIRRRRLLNGHRLQYLTHAMNDAHRHVGVIELNRKTREANRDSSGAAISEIKRDDWKALVATYQGEVAAIHANDKAIEAEALAE